MGVKSSILLLWSRYVSSLGVTSLDINAYVQYQVIRRRISIRIKNVENPKGGGTVIHPDPDIVVQQEIGFDGVPEPVSLAMLHEVSLEHKHKRVPTAVTIKEHIMVLNVISNRKNVSHG